MKLPPLAAFLQNKPVLNFLFCLGYFLMAKLGFEWGALTANATLLWPPSGLALFGFLVWGKRIFPGLLAGAIIAGQALSLSDNLGNTPFSFLIATINGSSSILQALLIAHYARAWSNQSFHVSLKATSAFVFLLLAGSTISSTIGNITLWQSGLVSFSEALQNWAVWWMGDSIGMLIVTPLLLWLHKRNMFRNNLQANAFLIFCGGIGIVLLSVAIIGHNERDTHRKNLTHQAANLLSTLQSHLDLAGRDLDMLQEYFSNTPPTQESFKNLTEPLLKRNPWVTALGWVPLVNDEKNSAKLAADFSSAITLERTEQQGFIWRNTSDTYRVNSLQLLVSKLAQNNHSEILPVGNKLNIFLAEQGYACEQANKCKIASLVSSELDADQLMQIALTKAERPSVDIILTDKATKSSWIWKYDHWQKTTIPLTGSARAPLRLNGQNPTLRLMDSQWHLLIIPTEIASWFLPSRFQLIVLLFGFSLVGLLAAYLQALYRQDQIIIENQAKLKEEIQSQTQALRVANDWLLKEIEERQATQEQLKANESHLRTLLDNVPDPIWFKSNEGKYLSFNKVVQAMFNRSQEEASGKTAQDFTDAELNKEIIKFEQEVLASNEAVRRQIWMYIPQRQQQRLMDILKVAVRNEEKKSIGILSIARDITEHYELVDQLEKFKRFAEFASEGLGIMTLAGETLYMNPSMNKMLNSNAGEAGYKKHFAHYYPLDIQQLLLQDIFPKVLKNGQWQGELAALHADGTRFPTKETFFIIRDDQGKPLYLGDVMSDISEQKQTEAALQLAKETAEEATRAKSRFLANMSHEIRTPLNAVLGYSQLLIADQQLNPQQRERMNSILNAGQRLLHLINDVLDLSKIEAGALHLRQDYFDLHKELDDIIALMNSKAVAKQLRLAHSILLPSPAIVKSDRQKIGQILLNLLGNAIKFTTTGEVNLSVTSTTNQIIFTIVDTGPGIAAQELKLLFAAFKQGKAGEESGGTGLGLVISKHIAQMLGGELILESAPGKGTRAQLQLPLVLIQNQSLELSLPISDARLAPGSHCKVLVVEDDFFSRDLLVNLLQNMGCDVVQARDGAEGLHAARTENFDIVFTDIRMPELSGSDMLRQLRQSITRHDLPVVAVSASSLEHERSFYLDEGFDEFIGKPYQFGDIYAALEKFTQAEFILGKGHEAVFVEPSLPVADLKAQPHIRTQLEQLRAAMSEGDMSNSKKLFLLQSPNTLGSIAFTQIQSALRQYDLELAEKILSGVLTQADSTSPSAT